ncbi:MAG TPA: hypothetical protein VGQ81_00300 [Acidobacteriota bacterium]|jgi:hypothetical protein|nr:hypothetical protein [Acidobacteriota bacterium]
MWILSLVSMKFAKPVWYSSVRLRYSAIRNPQSEIRNPQSTQSAIHNPQSTIRNPQSTQSAIHTIRNPQSTQSAIRNPHNPQSAIHNPQSQGGSMAQHFVLSLAVAVALAGSVFAQASGVMDRPVTVDYYYKAKWGYADEFLRLFLKNHYPVLKKQKEKGNILQIQIVKPRYHATEDGRWDYRVTLVYRNPAAMLSGPLGEAEMRQLYPDKTVFEREEQRRFEILLAHWDVPIEPVEPEQR